MSPATWTWSTLAVTTPLLTNRVNLYEFAFGQAPNDLDVELVTTVTAGTVSVFTAKSQRYPSPLRALDKGTCSLAGVIDTTITLSADCTGSRVWTANSVAETDGYWRTSGPTAAGSASTMVHTFKAEEARRLYITVRGDTASTAAGSTLNSEHHSTKTSQHATSTVSHGGNPGEAQYTIMARTFRYKIESETLDLTASQKGAVLQIALSTTAVVVNSATANTKTLVGAVSFATAGYKDRKSVV